MVKRSTKKYVGLSYAYKVQDINKIYDEHRKSGLSNIEIFRRFVYPKYFISLRSFYNMLNASADDRIIRKIDECERQLTLFF